MKFASLFLLLAAGAASAQTAPVYENILRQNQQASGVVWDMPVATVGSGPSALNLQKGGALFQLWTLNKTEVKEYLLDQKLVGAYLPKAAVKITTVDPYKEHVRTRIGEPFTVEIEVSDLLSGVGLPEASTKVLLQRHIASFPTGATEVNQATVTAGTPFASSYITQNGKNVIRFTTSSLTASNPTKASGEEFFVVHALSDGSYTQSQLSSARVKIWPVATGKILGIKNGDALRYEIPPVQINVNDLYPTSYTSLMLYEGSSVNGSPGVMVWDRVKDNDATTMSGIFLSERLSELIKKDGTYTIALMSNTIFGNELLDKEPITFTVDRTMEVNAMQVHFTDPSDKPVK